MMTTIVVALQERCTVKRREDVTLVSANVFRDPVHLYCNFQESISTHHLFFLLCLALIEDQNRLASVTPLLCVMSGQITKLE